MWKWIQENYRGLAAISIALAALAGGVDYFVGTEVSSQIRDDVQPKIIALQTTTTKHEENIKEIRTDLKEIKHDIRNLDQKFTSLHNFLIPMRDAIIEIQRDVKEQSLAISRLELAQ